MFINFDMGPMKSLASPNKPMIWAYLYHAYPLPPRPTSAGLSSNFLFIFLFEEILGIKFNATNATKLVRIYII